MQPITVTGQYARLSRGRIVAKHMTTGSWGKRGGGTVTLDQPGEWMISQTDGYSRKETVYVTVSEEGEVDGLGRRMETV